MRCGVTIFDERVMSWACHRTATVERNGKWYCWQHDPQTVEAKRVAADRAFTEKQAQSEKIFHEGKRICERLGYGQPHFAAPRRGSAGWARAILISFEDAERLIMERPARRKR